MSNTVKKNVLAGLVLVGVAGLSYAAGAAKAKAPAVTTPVGDLVWEEYGGGAPLKVAKLWGDRSKGEYAMLLKLPAGFEAGMHSHTQDYYSVNVQGNWIHTHEGETEPGKELAPGSYVMQPGKANHNDVCKGKVDCILFIHQHGKGDFIPATAPAEKAAAPAKK